MWAYSRYPFMGFTITNECCPGKGKEKMEKPS